MQDLIRKQSAVNSAKLSASLFQQWGTVNFYVSICQDGIAIEKAEFRNDSNAADRYYFDTCKALDVDPQPEYTKAVDLQKALIAVGWVHVHTWQESHGEYSSHIFEQPRQTPGHVPPQLILDIYRDSARPVELRTEVRPHGSYLLAREIKANEAGLWSKEGTREISPCCTSGSQIYVRKYSGDRVQLTSVAGHGEWANYLKE